MLKADIKPTTSRRRALAGGGALLAMLGGTAALATTSVRTSDGTPAANPDAELLALCGEFDRTELAFRAIYDGPSAIADDDEAEAASTDLGVTMNALLDQLQVTRAMTADGILARARTLAIHNQDFAFSFDDQDTVAGRLLDYLLRDAAGIDLVRLGGRG